VERRPSRVTVQVQLENGLVVRRTMRLGIGAEQLEVVMEYENEGDQPVAPRVKPHPEFWLQGGYEPELWIKRDAKWRMHEVQMLHDGSVGFAALSPEGVTQWAAYIPERKFSIVNAVRDEDISKLFYFVNVPDEHVNLEVIPNLTPLQPGEKRTIVTSYYTAAGPPKRLP